MKCLECSILLALLSLVGCHPIMICVPACSPNITASTEFVNKWLNHSSTTGIYQLQNRKNTVIHKLLKDTSTDIDDCEETYSSLVTIPENANITIDTIRGFFNAYLSHKYAIDYLVGLDHDELIKKNWVYYDLTLVHNLQKQLMKLQNVLNFNVKQLAQLLNSTCDACTRNCSQSNIIKANLISSLEDCASPIYNVVYTIARHSRKLINVVMNLQDEAHVSENDNLIAQTESDTEVNDLCLCTI